MKSIRSIFRGLISHINLFLNKPLWTIRGNNISWKSVISKGCIINKCEISAYTYIGPYCILNTVTVGRYSSIGPHVIIGGAEHSYWWYNTSHFISKLNKGGITTKIGNDVWIGAHAVIRQGTTIGNGAVIGAGAVVTKDVDPYSIVTGVPAHKLRMRFEKGMYSKIEETEYWNYPPKKAFYILNKLDQLQKIQNAF